MADPDPTIEEMRAQQAALERRLAQATVGPQAAFVALFDSAEVKALMEAVDTAAEPLSAASRKRITAWIKMRADIATLEGLELNRLRGLAAVAEDDSAHNN